jgi:hypothetical protein
MHPDTLLVRARALEKKMIERGKKIDEKNCEIV